MYDKLRHLNVTPLVHRNFNQNKSTEIIEGASEQFKIR